MGSKDQVKMLYCETPLIESVPLQKLCKIPVFLKLENTQPCGSFKLRGLSYLCREAIEKGAEELVCASGGNAGMAVAYVSKKLGIPAHIVVPETSPQKVKDQLEHQGASVHVHGRMFNEANEKAIEFTEESNKRVLIHPFDHPTIWDGHATMIPEIAKQLGSKPGVIVSCVGGGGLVCGIVKGLRRMGWEEVPVIAMETEGADSFNASVVAGKVITIPAITSVATCLGSVRVCDQLWEYFLDKRPKIISKIVPDREALNACIGFANDHRILVEPACGAALAACYSGVLNKLICDGDLGVTGPVVVIVCGGNAVDLELLESWKNGH